MRAADTQLRQPARSARTPQRDQLYLHRLKALLQPSGTTRVQPEEAAFTVTAMFTDFIQTALAYNDSVSHPLHRVVTSSGFTSTQALLPQGKLTHVADCTVSRLSFDTRCFSDSLHAGVSTP